MDAKTSAKRFPTQLLYPSVGEGSTMVCAEAHVDVEEGGEQAVNSGEEEGTESRFNDSTTECSSM